MVALAVVIPVILLPVLFIWFLNVGGMLAARREAKASEKATRQTAAVKVEAKG
jgi:hypothetical protein